MFSHYLKQIEESDEEPIFFLIVSGSGKPIPFVYILLHYLQIDSSGLTFVLSIVKLISAML